MANHKIKQELKNIALDFIERTKDDRIIKNYGDYVVWYFSNKRNPEKYTLDDLINHIKSKATTKEILDFIQEIIYNSKYKHFYIKEIDDEEIDMVISDFTKEDSLKIGVYIEINNRLKFPVSGGFELIDIANYKVFEVEEVEIICKKYKPKTKKK